MEFKRNMSNELACQVFVDSIREHCWAFVSFQTTNNGTKSAMRKFHILFAAFQCKYLHQSCGRLKRLVLYQKYKS